MKFDELQHMMQKPEVQPDTYEAGMALNQLLKIGKHAIKLHNMIDNDAEMESWVAKKIDLAGDYVKKVHGYMEGEKAGLYDDGGMTEDKHCGPGEYYCRMSGKCKPIPAGHTVDKDGTLVKEDASGFKLVSQAKDIAKKMAGNYSGAVRQIEKLQKDLSKNTSVKQALLQFNEDAGEGHMSKSTLYHTAKYAIALMDMIKKGDDLEGWVQSKLNKAADYLQGAYNYEEYQKLNPYREELDPALMQKHGQVIQKNLDEILARETKIADVDTKPGMMRILAKRVNEVEKEIAKETRKQNEGKMSDIDADMKTLSDEDFMKKYKKSKEQMKKDLNEDGHTDVPSAIRNCVTIIEDAMQMKQKLETMQGELPSWMTQMIAVAASDLNDARDYLLNPTSESGIMYRAGVKKYGKKGMTAIQSAAGKGASHQEIGKIKDKYIKDDEQFDEGIKEWGKRLAMAGVIVAGLAGVNSINNAIDNSVPAITAMNTALEMAQDSNNTELAKMIEKDLSDAKIRLSSGKDLSHVADMQEKYAKFMKTEGLAYESKLAVQLNQQLK